MRISSNEVASHVKQLPFRPLLRNLFNNDYYIIDDDDGDDDVVTTISCPVC